MLAGGGAMLGGLPLLINERTGIRVTVAKTPLESVCLGIGRVIESPGGIGSVLRQRTR
jgi:rod shape-determining protein MreB